MFVKLTLFFSKFCQNAKKIQLCSLQMLFVKFLVKEPQVLNWVHNFFFFFKGANIDWPISNSFGTLGMAPIEAPLWTPSCKIYTVVLPYVLPFQFRVELLPFRWELNFGQTILDKTQVLLGTSWRTH